MIFSPCIAFKIFSLTLVFKCFNMLFFGMFFFVFILFGILGNSLSIKSFLALENLQPLFLEMLLFPLFSFFFYVMIQFQIRSDQPLSRVRLFATPWIKAHQASLSITNSWCSLMPSHNTYCLTWVSHTLDMVYLFTASPAKHSCCSLPWMRGISSRPPLLTLNVE